VAPATTRPIPKKKVIRPVFKTPIRRTRRFKIAIALVAVALVVSALVVYELTSQQKSINIISGNVPVGGDLYNATVFTTPASNNIHIVGSFSSKVASGSNTGISGTITVLIVNDTYYYDYVYGGSLPPGSASFYNSGPVASGSFNVNLPPSTRCWIVYWDMDTDGTSRTVTTTVNLFYG
jgi:hypothetical protein